VDFELSDDQKMLARTVAAFAQKESPTERFRKLRDDEVGWDAGVWKSMGELGWLAVPFPEAIGGFGGSFVDVALVLEKLGTTLVPEPYLASVVLGGLTVLRSGTVEQQERFLSPMMEGRTSLALAWAERRGRYDAGHCETRAERDGSGYVLTGEKTFVLNGHAADHLVVSAREPGGVSLFVLDRDTPGLTIRTVKTQDGHKAGWLALEGATIAADRRLGDEGTAAGALELALDYGAAAACAEGLGIVDTMLAMTVEYLKTRKQFGVEIGAFQALQHRGVDMFIEAQVCRSMSILASLAVDFDDPDRRRSDVSAAKAHLSVGGGFVARQAIQLHGGIGITDEHDIGLFFKRLNVLCALFGDEEHHVRRFSRLPTFTAEIG
jgi:alkylation response protein AidB-like acyl-CoA dehydrogenase